MGGIRLKGYLPRGIIPGMRRLWPILLLFVIGGCGESNEPEAALAVPNEPVAHPDVLERGQLCLIGPVGQIHVGDSQDEAEKVFPAPSGSFAVKELPAGFEPPYRARGYESSRDGFAAVLFGERVALAMRREEDVQAASVAALVDRYIAKFGNPDTRVDGPLVTYRFWEREGQRLAIYEAPDVEKTERRDVTVAVGTFGVMDAVRLSQKTAQEDSKAGEKIWANYQMKGKK